MSKIEHEVCEMIQQRAKVGLNKYGVTMERDDLERDDWLEHLQHELMDAVVYIQRLRTREETLESKLRQLLEEPEPVSDFNKRSRPSAEQREMLEWTDADTLSAYRQRLSEEAKESIAKKKAEGKVFTGEVFGWDRDGDDMIPNWREQDIIDYMRFRHYEQNWSGNKLAKHFNTLELKGKKGGAWTSSMVLRTCRYEFHANRRKFSPPIWWGREAYHDAVEYNYPIPELKEEA